MFSGYKKTVKRYRFSDKDLLTNTFDLPTWHEFVRRREFEIILQSLSSKTRFQNALELGAGEGGQSVTIAKYCDQLTCTELSTHGNALIGNFAARDLPNVKYMLCDACDLSQFYGHAFDLIFSSNMLEHVPAVQQCLLECKKVLKGTGLMIHTMPTRNWKLWNCIIDISKRQPHHIHGVSKTHMHEWGAFSRRRWESEFSTAGFRLIDVVGLPFYFGHGPSPLWLLRLGNRLKWSGTRAYVCGLA